MSDARDHDGDATLLLDRHRVEEVIGEGAFGTVIRAFDTLLKRTVAIKTLKQSAAALDFYGFSRLKERFLHEAEVGSLVGNHPNLVTVYDLVQDETGTWFLISEYVPGGTLAHHLAAAAPLPLDDALRLTADIARGLQAAHDAGLVHRDVKPANIFLAADGRAQVGDFGIAQIDHLSQRTHATMGHPDTPLYMSPEQAQRTSYLLPQSDQYSVGLVLFEMLTGAALKRLMESKIAELLAGQPAPVRALIRRMTAEAPDDRYRALRDALSAITAIRKQLPFETGPLASVSPGTSSSASLPPVAGSDGTVPSGILPAKTIERPPIGGTRRIGRRAVLAGAGGLLAAGSIAGALATTQRHGVALATATPAPPAPSVASVSAADAAPASTATIAASAATSPVAVVERAAITPVPTAVRATATPRSLQPPPTPPVPPALPGTPITLIETTITPDTTAHVVQLAQWGKGIMGRLAWLPDGNQIAVTTAFGVSPRDASTLEQARFLPSPTALQACAVSPDGERLALVASTGYAHILRLGDGTLVRELGIASATVLSVAFAPDSTSLVAGGRSTLWRVVNDGPLMAVKGTGNANGVAYAPDGQTFASASDDGTVRIYRAANGQQLFDLRGHTGEVPCVTYSPDSATLASGGGWFEPNVHLWRVSDGAALRTLRGQMKRVFDVAFSPDGKTIASAAFDRTIRLWRVSDGAVQRALTDHTARVVSVAYAPDGQTFVSASDDGSLRVRKAADGTVQHSATDYNGAFMSAAVSPDGQLAATGSSDTTITVWRVRDGTPVATLKSHADPVACVAFSPDGSLLATGGSDAVVKVWRVSNWAEQWSVRTPGWILAVAFAPDGQTLAVANSSDTEHSVQVLRATNGTQTAAFTGHASQAISLAFTPDGQMVASGGKDKTVRLWRAADGTEVRSLTPRTGRAVALCITPDGKTLIAGTNGESPIAVQAWTIPDASARSFSSAYSGVETMALSPDGGTLAAGLDGGLIQLWRVSDGANAGQLFGHTNTVRGIAFTPDGRTIVSSSDDGTVRLWGVHT